MSYQNIQKQIEQVIIGNEKLNKEKSNLNYLQNKSRGKEL